MTTRLPAASRRRQLLEVAIEVFGRSGYHETSMNDVARAAGVTKPVLYQHFASKRELFAAVLSQVGTDLRRRLTTALDEATGPRDQVERGFRTYFRYITDHPASYRVLFLEAGRADPELALEARRTEATIARVVAALIDIPELDHEARMVLAHGVVGLAEGAARYAMERSAQAAPDELAGLATDLAWGGLKGL